MRPTIAAAAALVALVASSVQATPLAARQNNDAATALANKLKEMGLTNLADVLSANLPVVTDIINSPGTKTLLAPDNQAIAAYPAWTTNNTVLLQSTLLMHVLNGTYDFNDLARTPLHTVGHSFLTNPTYVNLPGGNGQAVALTSSPAGERYVQEAVNVNNFDGAVQAQELNGVTIQPITRGLTVPGNASFTANYIGNHTQFGKLLAAVPDLVSKVDNMRGSTIFVPSDEAIAKFTQGNQVPTERLAAILSQHLIANRVVYSPLAEQGSFINAAGQDIAINGQQNTVTIRQTSATISQYDIMHKGGVIHLIDTVLGVTDVNQTRADAAAASSAASAASYIAGPISVTNAATSQGQNIPGPDALNPGEGYKNAEKPATSDASGGNGAAAGTPGAAGGATAGVAAAAGAAGASGSSGSGSNSSSTGNGTSTGTRADGAMANSARSSAVVIVGSLIAAALLA